MALSFVEMVTRMKKCQELSDHYYGMLLLFSLHTRLRDLLPNNLCLYAVFLGRTSTGKSNGAQYTCEISKGEWVVDASEAFLLDVLDSGGNVITIGIDQLEDQVQRNPNLLGLLEAGNQWTAHRGMKVQVKKGNKTVWESRKVPCGGPKVFSALMAPRKTMANRCYEIHTFPGSDPIGLSTEFSLREPDVKEISDSLDEYAASIALHYTPLMVQQRLRSVEHRNTLLPLVRPGVEGRRLGLAHVFEIVRWMTGWPVDVIDALNYEVVDEDEETFKHILYRVMKNGFKPAGETNATDLLGMINEEYRAICLPGFTPKSLGETMQSVGFTFASGLKTHTRSGNSYNFNLDALKMIRPGDFP